MASLTTHISDLATRIATEIKSVRGIATAAQTAAASAAKIDDVSASSTTATRSSTKIDALIAAAVSGLVDGSPGLLDTLKELADAIGDDANFATTISTALGYRLRFDAPQTLTGAQQTQGQANLSVYSQAAIGTPDTDFVAVFNAGTN